MPESHLHWKARQSLRHFPLLLPGHCFQVWQFPKTSCKIVQKLHTLFDHRKQIISPSLSAYFFIYVLLLLQTIWQNIFHSTGKNSTYSKELKGKEDPCLHMLWGVVFSGPKLLWINFLQISSILFWPDQSLLHHNLSLTSSSTLRYVHFSFAEQSVELLHSVLDY